jgi:hypothetical protein
MEFHTLHTGNKPHRASTPDMWADAKAYGLAHGYKGELGGWIYNKDGQHVAHGWGQFYFVVGGMTIERWKKEKGMEE